VPYYHANAAHVHVCLPQIAGAPVIGSRGSGSSLIGLAADNAAPWYLICTCATYCLLESFLGSSIVSNECVYYSTSSHHNSHIAVHRRAQLGRVSGESSGFAIARFSLTPSPITRSCASTFPSARKEGLH
jgi:hypothetical protein